ncbi:MAG: hypothetical protein WAQ05_26885 [Rubrivivax sp.]
MRIALAGAAVAIARLRFGGGGCDDLTHQGQGQQQGHNNVLVIHATTGSSGGLGGSESKTWTANTKPVWIKALRVFGAVRAGRSVREFDSLGASIHVTMYLM